MCKSQAWPVVGMTWVHRILQRGLVRKYNLRHPWGHLTLFNKAEETFAPGPVAVPSALPLGSSKHCPSVRVSPGLHKLHSWGLPSQSLSLSSACGS